MYKPLAQKYRPRRFEDVIGQDSIVRSLANAFNKGRYPQTILLAGPPGVGKTTIARIIECCYNCDGAESRPIMTPCGTCQTCSDAIEGRRRYREFNGVDATGVKDLRDMLRNQRGGFLSRARYYVFIINEAQSLSRQAFEALSAPLEEPRTDEVFILCTTAPNKVPDAIQSRCIHLGLRGVATSVMVPHLKHIAKSEGVNLDPPVIEMIAREANGMVRKALTDLDLVISYSITASPTEDQVRDLIRTNRM